MTATRQARNRMLLDSKQIAVNDLIVAFDDSIEHCRDVAEQLQKPEHRAMLQRFIAERERLVERLNDLIRALGELPRVADTEREQLEQLVTRVKAALSADEQEVLLNDRLMHDHKLLELVHNALDEEFASDQRRFLESLKTHLQDSVREMSAAVDEL